MSGGGRKGEKDENREECAQIICSSLFERDWPYRHIFLCNQPNLQRTSPPLQYTWYIKMSWILPISVTVTSNLML